MGKTSRIRVRVLGSDGLRERIATLAARPPDCDSAARISLVEATADADCVVTSEPDRVDPTVPTVVVADDLSLVTDSVAGFVRSDAPVEHLADQLRLAVRPGRRAARSRAERLHGISTRIVACDDPSAVYELAVEAADRILDFDFSYVAEAGEVHFEPKAFSASMAPDGYDDAMRIDEGIAGETYQRGESILLEDLAEVSDAKPADDAYRAALSVPIGDFGVFQAASRTPAAFDEHDRELVELLMSHVGETVDRLRTESELRARNRAIERLHTVATGLVTCETETELCRRVVEAAEEVLDFEVCVVVTEVGDGESLEIRAASDSPLAPPVGGSVPADAGIVGETYRTGESVLVRDVAAETRAEPHAEAYQSALSVPFGDFGVVQAIDDQPGAYDERDRHLTELFVSQAAAVAARIRAEDGLRAERDRLQEFASVVSHDLRNPLNVAEGYVTLALETGNVDSLERAASALDRMDGLIDDVLALARQQAVEQTTAVDVPPLVDAAAHNVGLDRVDVEAESLVVEADRDRLLRLLENLLRNCVEHGSTSSQDAGRPDDAVEHGTPTPPPAAGVEPEATTNGGVPDVSVTVSPLVDDGAVVGFYVADDGPGIPAEERDDVFDSGYTTTGAGTGLGLAIVQSIARAHGWTASVTESDAGGARFEIRTG